MVDMSFVIQLSHRAAKHPNYTNTRASLLEKRMEEYIGIEDSMDWFQLQTNDGGATLNGGHESGYNRR